jgi:hypothetical protein
MPAVVKSTEGSFSGTNEAEGMMTCPFERKKLKYTFLSSLVVMLVLI